MRRRAIRKRGGSRVGVAEEDGGASLFAWRLWHLINVLSLTALVRDQVGDMALLNLAASSG